MQVRTWIEAMVGGAGGGAGHGGGAVRVGESPARVSPRRPARALTTSLGPADVHPAPARLGRETGATTEWRSTAVARKAADASGGQGDPPGVLSSTDTGGFGVRWRRCCRTGRWRGRGVRLVGRLKDEFEQWRQRSDLAEQESTCAFCSSTGGIRGCAWGRGGVPVLVALGVRADDQKVLVDLRLVGDESTAAWRDTIRSLVDRHVGTPALAPKSIAMRGCVQRWGGVADAGGAAVLQRTSSETSRRRPRSVSAGGGYQQIIYTKTATRPTTRGNGCVRKWKLQCPAEWSRA